MTSSEFGFEAFGLVKRFGRTTALDGVDLAAPAGTVLGVLGPNGAGKTTAVRVLATLLRPDAGRAAVGGHDVVRDAARVRRLIALAGQHATVDDELTGLANLVLVGRLLDLRRADAVARARELLDRFDLTEAAGRRVATYSGGMRRRLDLAASLVGRPRVLFLDEPSAGLDPGRRDELWRTVRRLRDDGVTVLLTTQYLEEADALADTVAVVDRGRVVACDTPAALKRVVGGQTLAVRPADPSDAPAVADLLARVAGRPADRAGGELVVPVDGDAVLLDAARALRDRDITVAEFALRLPSLDEVFHALVGSTKEAA
ncbi:oleandomycin transport system ATP-binding protein [Spirilliplanes yamanashiensis]|nr:ATP-binding cassette domain-containing protein [Spirilliplanes yamanashiensis]MDP9815537.1 oleandomycin transport system ATP-binding protein [Spirilliplanes yamanashiensis]